jgi:hypothetical protein
VVTHLTTPSRVVDPPAIGAATAASIHRGQQLYSELGCRHCHGPDGSGTDGAPLFDERGHVVAPRDLAHDPMKGGPDAESLFLRIRLGMPGTPHPAASGIDDADLIALVHFCQSFAVNK